MPNHIHGIIIIRNKNNNGINNDVDVGDINVRVETPQWGVSTGNKIKQWKPNSLGLIINQYKSICTKKIRKLHNIDFKWQSRFHDHIIRNDKSLCRIREYITNNPMNWYEDKEYAVK